MELPPEHAQEFRHIAEEDLGALDERMAGWAEGDQEIKRRDAGLTVMDGEDGFDRCRLAAPAGVAVSIENPFAEAGELSLVGSHPAIAALTETASPDRARAAAAEEHPLPGLAYFPALDRSGRRGVSLRRRGRFSQSLVRRFRDAGWVAEERTGWGEKLKLRHENECSRDRARQLTLSEVVFKKAFFH
jgi:hypothetical protein